MRKQITSGDFETAIELRNRDARARQLAMSCVAYAMTEEAGTDVPPDARRYAHDVATLATALLVSLIYIEDAELRALVAERDALKEMALGRLNREPLAMFVPKDKP